MAELCKKCYTNQSFAFFPPRYNELPRHDSHDCSRPSFLLPWSPGRIVQMLRSFCPVCALGATLEGGHWWQTGSIHGIDNAQQCKANVAILVLRLGCTDSDLLKVETR